MFSFFTPSWPPVLGGLGNSEILVRLKRGFVAHALETCWNCTCILLIELYVSSYDSGIALESFVIDKKYSKVD